MRVDEKTCTNKHMRTIISCHKQQLPKTYQSSSVEMIIFLIIDTIGSLLCTSCCFIMFK